MLTQVQKVIVSAGVACLALLACYLPWVHTAHSGGGVHREKPAGYHFIFDPPQPESESVTRGVKIDIPRVAIPMMVVVICTIAAVLLAGSRHLKQDTRERLTGARTDECPNLPEKIERSDLIAVESVSSIGLPANAPGTVEQPAATPDHSRRERDGVDVFSTTIAVVMIWGACRAVFGSGFGGLIEAFFVILIGSFVGPRVARRLAHNSPASKSAKPGRHLSGHEIQPAPVQPTIPLPSETGRGGATRPELPRPAAEVASGAIPAAASEIASNKQASDDGPPRALLLTVFIGSTIGVAIVLLTQGRQPPLGNAHQVAPPAQGDNAAPDTSDDPFLALLSSKRGYDTPIEKRDYDAIVRRENEFIRRDPNDTHGYRIRGFAWLEKKEYDRAIDDFTQATRTQPPHAMAGDRAVVFIDRGTARLEKGDHGAAIEDFDEALRILPNYAYAISRRANAWSDKGEYEKAVRDYAETIRIDPEYRFEDYINLAWLLATCTEDKFRDGPRAVELAKRACEISTWKSGWALNSLAAAYAETGRFDEAVRYQNKALEDPAYQGPAGDEFRDRRWLYRAEKPYRGPVQHQHPTGRVAPFRG